MLGNPSGCLKDRWKSSENVLDVTSHDGGGDGNDNAYRILSPQRINEFFNSGDKRLAIVLRAASQTLYTSM